MRRPTITRPFLLSATLPICPPSPLQRLLLTSVASGRGGDPWSSCRAMLSSPFRSFLGGSTFFFKRSLQGIGSRVSRFLGWAQVLSPPLRLPAPWYRAPIRLFGFPSLLRLLLNLGWRAQLSVSQERPPPLLLWRLCARLFSPSPQGFGEGG